MKSAVSIDALAVSVYTVPADFPESDGTLEWELDDAGPGGGVALSKQSPTEPIDGRTPASPQRLPNAMEVYWHPWSE